MLTPGKNSRKDRVHTTASTQHVYTVSNNTESGGKPSIRFFYQDVEPVRQKLFESRVEKSRDAERVEKSRDAERVQGEYRKKMIRYLDEKFQGKGVPMVHLKSQKGRNSVRPEKPKIRLDQVKALLKQFMEVIRANNITKMSQFYLAVVLKELGFIRSILDDRAIARKVWKELKEPSTMETFVFVTFSYFHGISKKSKPGGLISKNEICQAVEDCFKEQGYPFSRKFIERAYDISSLAPIDSRTRTDLLNNRQSRPTCSSLQRSVSHKRA